MASIPSRGAVALACLFAGVPAAQAAGYHLVDLGDAPLIASPAINSRGEVAGTTPDGHAGVYANGAWVARAKGRASSTAESIDKAGDAVGEIFNAGGGSPMYYPHGNKAGTAISLPDGALYGIAEGISPDGSTVVGTYSDPQNPYFKHCFRWTPGAAVATDLGFVDPYRSCEAHGVNDAGEIVGTLDTTAKNGRVSFTYVDGAFDIVDKSGKTILQAVNAKGQASGTTYPAGTAQTSAAYWNGKTLRDVGAGNGLNLWAGPAINGHGDIVGQGTTATSRTMVLRTGGQLLDLVPLIVDDISGWDFNAFGMPTGINDSGTIVGYAYSPTDSSLHTILLVPVAGK